jgi:hypothetical protein
MYSKHLKEEFTQVYIGAIDHVFSTGYSGDGEASDRNDG